MRDPALLGESRFLARHLSVRGKHGDDAGEAERALDQALVDMVTRNPAKTLRWYDEVGSIERGKTADLFVITRPHRAPREGIPASAYRSLIDATERDVRLVMVGGDPLVGDPDTMTRLKPGDSEPLVSSCGCTRKMVDVTKTGLPKGDQTLAVLERTLGDALIALGGDNPPAGGGPAALTNTYSYLKQRFTLPFPMTDAQFMNFVLIPTAGTVGGKLNAERLTLPPLLVQDDDFFFDVLGMRSTASGLIDDPTPPFHLYQSNANQAQNGIDPFSPRAFEDRWYRLSKWRPDGAHDDRGPVCVNAASTPCERRLP
jgi:hypothetical protein